MRYPLSKAAIAQHGASTDMAMIIAPALCLFLLDLAASAQVPSQPDTCSWVGMRKCYSNLGLQNMITMNQGQGLHISDKMFTEMCRKMTLPSPCFNQLSACPAYVKANLSSFEEGYKQLREMNCDKNALEDSLKLLSCMDFMSILLCSQKNLIPTSDAPKLDECSTIKQFSTCAESAVVKSCPADQKAVTSSVKQGMTASLLMMGCETSSQAGLVPVAFTVALVASFSIMQLKTT